MSMGDLFDAVAGERAKQEGMARAADNRAVLLEMARGFAHQHALLHGTVTADDVARQMAVHGFSPSALGPAAGSLFKTSEWEWTGEYVKSIRVSNHSRMIRVWRLAR